MLEGRHGSVAEVIRLKLGTLTATERRPAQLLLNNYPMAGLETVASFAKSAGVSGPTILRLIGKLGFSGYGDFQRALRDELQARLKSPLTKREHGGGPAEGAADFLLGYAESACDNVWRSLETLPRQDFEGTLALLAKPSHSVYLLGGRFTDPLAQYFYAHLRAIRDGVHRIEGQPDTWPEYLLDLGRRDVLVVFDIRRYQDDIIAFAERAWRQGAATVLITDQWMSPIARFAKHVFSLRIEAPSNWDSSVAQLVLVEAMIAALTDRCWPSAKDRIERLELLKSNK